MSKRKSDQYLEMSEPDLDYVIEDMSVTDSCDVVRRKVRALIDSGEMKVKEFKDAIGASSVTCSSFMGQNGPFKGAGSSVYQNAWAFFKKRELQGVRALRRHGLMTESVEVYDTCDEIRRKINAHLRKPEITQAAFLREIAAQFHTANKKIQSKQLNDFRSKKGAYTGNTSVVFYGAYVYFEKLRLGEGKPKSKAREEMERIYRAEGGIEVPRRRVHVKAPNSVSVSQD
ncbi:hypothetical protein BDV95DRAFT_590911 [Massariosphaeria phaeospora]|uniref:DUF7726 domain-containing protein n=1 Tax=Massariosphaeria phaeospora TaxID=100035 RepID=A0A7C8IBH2_9PLEO|nr:hypothetical protein BDV95DRAFT_590911 [Massariosphaeria phaeospora]